MKRLVSALLLLAATSVSAFAQVPPYNQVRKHVPVPSYWVSNHGIQLKIYAIDGNKVSGIVNSPTAPPGCQYTTFELHGEYAHPEVAIGTDWKNWGQDCHATTFWDGIIVRGRELRMEWQTIRGKGLKTHPVAGGYESFWLQP